MNMIYLLIACEFFSGDTFEVGAFSTHAQAEAVKAEYEARKPLEIAHYTIRPVDFDQPANPKWLEPERGSVDEDAVTRRFLRLEVGRLLEAMVKKAQGESLRLTPFENIQERITSMLLDLMASRHINEAHRAAYLALGNAVMGTGPEPAEVCADPVYVARWYASA